MSGEKRDFDKEAASWDNNPVRVKLANDIADTLSEAIKPAADMDVLDFGCGTGILALRLQPFVRSVTGVDSSQGMLDVFNKKIKGRNAANVKTQFLDIAKGDILEGNYNLVVSSMALHHIRETQPLLRQFHKILQPSGRLCVFDLDPDGGRFHESNEGIFHFGFDRTEMRRNFTEIGFKDVYDRTAAKVVKPSPQGGDRTFTVFLIMGRI